MCKNYKKLRMLNKMFKILSILNIDIFDKVCT